MYYYGIVMSSKVCLLKIEGYRSTVGQRILTPSMLVRFRLPPPRTYIKKDGKAFY